MMTDLEFVLVDVFAERVLEGNQLAVFPEARGLDGALMQKIAREMNLSETVFVTSSGDDRYESRIFTPFTELPFAGHPTLGTAWALREIGAVEGETITQTTAAGETPVAFESGVPAFRRTGSGGDDIEDVEALARAIGLDPGSVGAHWPEDDEKLLPAIANAGIPQLMVPLGGRAALDALEPSRIRPAEEASGGTYFFSVQGHDRIAARMMAGAVGVAEDPATGSAAAALGLYLGQRAGDCEFRIEQGGHVGRPSILHVRVQGGVVTVSGRVVLAGKGRLVLDVTEGDLAR